MAGCRGVIALYTGQLTHTHSCCWCWFLNPQEKKLQLYNFDGVKEREWVLDSVIRYIKVGGQSHQFPEHKR